MADRIVVESTSPFTIKRKLGIVLSSLAFNAALVTVFLFYFGPKSSYQGEYATYIESEILSSVNIFKVVDFDKTSVPYSVLINITLLSTCVLLAWFFIQSESDNQGLTLTVNQMTIDLRALVACCHRLYEKSATVEDVLKEEEIGIPGIPEQRPMSAKTK